MSFDAQRVLEAIRALPLGEIRLMEVCGTHTMAIAKSGLRSMLPENIKLLSGPGCPVCVTPGEVIDAVLELAMRPGLIITTYGDMVRVPGSTPGDNLARRRALGAKIEVVYSPVDAVGIARENPDKEIVFLGVGFETTAPGTAAAVLTAKENGVKNFSLFSMLKTVEPALRALIASEGFNVQGFLCPGHVATIIGGEGFEFLPRDYGLPAVISGFEPEDILSSVYLLTRQLAEGKSLVQNEYRRAVAPQGNPLARAMMEKCFAPRRDLWRGLGAIEESGLALRDELAEYDAEKKFGIAYKTAAGPTACRCGEVITGRLSPAQCPLFGKRCVPEDPVGPCMVSSEGACAAYYKYQTV
ncbi:MAG: hydrogenase formation protein HypD [Oscillospiraceae bacterium]|nr:hydrogenase formation protein HypD [Oscillospiraceae bacterium]